MKFLRLLDFISRYWREGLIGALILVLIFMLDRSVRDRREVEKAKLVYGNPEIRVVTKEVRIEGPVRVITKIIERPSGETITIVDESRGEVRETKDSENGSKPIPLAISLAPARTDRWIAGVQVDDGRFREMRGYTGLVGYSIQNRVDLMAGYGGEGSKIQANLRF